MNNKSADQTAGMHMLICISVGCMQQSPVFSHLGPYMVNVLKFWARIIRARIHKILVRIANREDPDQTASSEAV